MAFKIVITETKTVRKTLPKSWEIIGQKNIGGEGDTPMIVDERGYTPEIETLATERTEILSQEVENLDLISVIKAINRIP